MSHPPLPSSPPVPTTKSPLLSPRPSHPLPAPTTEWTPGLLGGKARDGVLHQVDVAGLCLGWGGGGRDFPGGKECLMCVQKKPGVWPGPSVSRHGQAASLDLGFCCCPWSYAASLRRVAWVGRVISGSGAGDPRRHHGAHVGRRGRVGCAS